MNIEEEIFKRTHVDIKKLEKYGFKKEMNNYKFSKKFMNGDFRTDISIDKEGNVTGKVYDLEFDAEYKNFRLETYEGTFASKVREQYKKILNDIRNKCFNTDFFISNQANRITKYIIQKYDDVPKFLWEKFSGYGVFRNKNNGKWYGIIMNIDKSKITTGTGEIEILNIKCDEDKVESLIRKKGYYNSYHMNKKSWITVILDDTLSDNEIIELIDNSYNIVSSPEEWIVPVNPKYYDIINCFNNTDTIIWKQSSNINIGDIVYLYVGSPYSIIMYKCKVLKVNIPYEYKDNNVSMKQVMEIKLIKRYKNNDITLKKLNELGIKIIRGTRKISKTISKNF